MTDFVLAERRGSVLLLTLNRPSAYNALSMALMEALQGEVVVAGHREERAEPVGGRLGVVLWFIG